MIGSSKNQSAGQDTEWRDGFDAEFTSAVWCVEQPSDEETALMQAAGGVGLFDKAAVIEALYPAIHEAVKHLQTELSVQRSING